MLRAGSPLSSVIPLGLLSLLMLLGACQDTTEEMSATEPTNEKPRSDGPITMVATFSIPGDLARGLGGDDIDLTVLVGPGSDVHHYRPSPQDLKALRRAELVVENGLQLQSWLDDAYQASGTQAKRIVLSEGITPIDWHGHPMHAEELAEDHDHIQLETVDHEHTRHPTHAHEHHHDHAHGHHHDHAHDADCTSHGCGQHHDHGAADPHIWLDPVLVKRMVTTLSQALEQARPEQANRFQDRRDELLAELDRLHAELLAGFERIPTDRRQIITGHHSLGYFAKRYGFKVHGSEIHSLSGKQLAALVDFIRDHRITAIFPEVMLDDRVLRRVAEEAGISLAEPLFTGSLATDLPQAQTYCGMMRENAARIHRGLTEP